MLADTNNLSYVSGQKAGRMAALWKMQKLLTVELAEQYGSVTALVHIAPHGKVLRPTYVAQVT